MYGIKGESQNQWGIRLNFFATQSKVQNKIFFRMFAVLCSLSLTYITLHFVVAVKLCQKCLPADLIFRLSPACMKRQSSHNTFETK